MSGPYPLPIPVLVQVVNQWGDAPRAAAGESADPYPEIGQLRAEHPEIWAHLPQPDPPVLVEVANRIHPVFAAGSGEECARRLNRLVAEAGLAPLLAADAWTVREVWRTAAPGRELLAAAVLSLLEHLRHEPDASRLSTCHGEACVDVYVDQSPAGRRRYCSLTCQNRARTRAYRAARRAGRRPARGARGAR